MRKCQCCLALIGEGRELRCLLLPCSTRGARLHRARRQSRSQEVVLRIAGKGYLSFRFEGGGCDWNQRLENKHRVSLFLKRNGTFGLSTLRCESDFAAKPLWRDRPGSLIVAK